MILLWKKLDRYLLRNKPHLWGLQIHYNLLGFGVLGNLLLFLFGLAIPSNAFVDMDWLLISVVMLLVFGECVWVYALSHRQVRINSLQEQREVFAAVVIGSSMPTVNVLVFLVSAIGFGQIGQEAQFPGMGMEFLHALIFQNGFDFYHTERWEQQSSAYLYYVAIQYLLFLHIFGAIVVVIAAFGAAFDRALILRSIRVFFKTDHLKKQGKGSLSESVAFVAIVFFASVLFCFGVVLLSGICWLAWLLFALLPFLLAITLQSALAFLIGVIFVENLFIFRDKELQKLMPY